MLLASVASSQSSSSVRIGLFNGRAIHQLKITGYSGLRVSSRIATGAVTITRHGPMVFARDTENTLWQESHLTLASRSGRYIDLDVPGLPPKRTLGIVEVIPRGDGLVIVNILPIETYVLGVVNGELGSLHFNPESMKAQIVASRSFVLASRGRHHSENYDFCDGPHCQVFTGTTEINTEYKIAVDETRGQFLTFAGHAIPGYFHDNCGGRTAAIQDVWGTGDVPYLQSVEDLYCSMSPRAHWTYHVDRRHLREALRDAGWISGNDALDSLHIAKTDRSGRADQIAIQCNHSFWITASVLRQTLGHYFHKEVLPSTLFTIERQGEQFVFSGRGWGHGVGLCQWGAIEMAKGGKTYIEILEHYYPGTRLERLPDEQYAFQKEHPAIN